MLWKTRKQAAGMQNSTEAADKQDDRVWLWLCDASPRENKSTSRGEQADKEAGRRNAELDRSSGQARRNDRLWFWLWLCDDSWPLTAKKEATRRRGTSRLKGNGGDGDPMEIASFPMALAQS